MALKADPWAGMMLTFPVDSSTSWTCPGVRPGNTSVFEDRQQRPNGLSAVSKTAQRWGGSWNLYTWMLLWRATTICSFVNLTPRTVVRTGIWAVTFCLASSHMITFTRSARPFWRFPPAVTDFVLREFGLLSTSYERNIVGFTKHINRADARVEIWGSSARVWEDWGGR